MIEFEINHAEFNRGIKAMAGRLGISQREVLRTEAGLTAKDLIKFEFRAGHEGGKNQSQGVAKKKIQSDLERRMLVLHPSGEEYHVPDDDRPSFKSAGPISGKIHYRARRQHKGDRHQKRIRSSSREVNKYKRRYGYLASGWGAAAVGLGVKVPAFLKHHQLSKNGRFEDNSFQRNPHFVFENHANPRSDEKLKKSLAIRRNKLNRALKMDLEKQGRRYGLV